MFTEDDADAELADHNGPPVTSIRKLDVGALGGTVKCGVSRLDEVPASLCVWVDRGTFGFAIYENRSLDDSAVLFTTMRKEMLQRR